MKKLLIALVLITSLSTVNAQSISSISPNSAHQGDVLTVNITGLSTSFVSATGLNVWFEQGSNVINPISSTPNTETTLSANLNINISQATGQYDVKVQNSIDGIMTLTNGFEVVIVSGINYTSEDINLNVYPNPTSDYIFISSTLSENNDVYISVFDLNGKAVRNIEKKAVNTLNEKIDINKLPSGVYSVVVKVENQFYTKKIVKK